MAEYYCTIPMLILLILAGSSNVSMVVHIIKFGNSSHGAGCIFMLIGVSNATVSIFVCVQSIFRKMTVPAPATWFVSIVLTIAFILQMSFNVVLAVERLEVVSKPLKYRTQNAKKSLERKLCLVVVILSIIVGGTVSSLRLIFDNYLIMSASLSASRIIGYITLSVIYCKLYFAMKSQNSTVGEGQVEQGGLSASNNHIIARRRERLEHSRRFFIGITMSFFVLNLPIMVTFLTTKERPHCTSTMGIISNVSVMFSNLNMVFDTIWYFYMNRRAKHLQNAS